MRRLHGHDTARAPFDDVDLRKAVELGDRPPGTGSPARRFAGKRTTRSGPGIPGYKPFSVYAIKGADVAKAKQVGGAAIDSAPTLNVVHPRSFVLDQPCTQVAEYNLKQVGFKINDVPTPRRTTTR